MSDASILKEFLVSLGFKVDPASENRFKDSVKSATSQMKEFSVAMAAAATESMIGLNRMANDLGALHFQSQRVGASANNIKALQFAFQQVGGTAEGASATLETFASKLRDSPGWADMISKTFNVDVSEGADKAEALLKIGEKLNEMPIWQAKAYTNTLGIDEKSLLALRNPETRKAFAEQIALQKQFGNNLDESAAKASEFSKEMNELKQTFGSLVDGMTGDLSGKLVPILHEANIGMKEFADWFHELPEDGQEAIKVIAEVGVGLTAIVANIKLIAAAKGLLGSLLGKTPPSPPAPPAPTPPPAPVAGGAAAGGAAEAEAAAAAGGSRWLSVLSKWAGGVGLMLHSEDLNQGEDEFVRKQIEDRKRKKLTKPSAAPAPAAAPVAPAPPTAPAAKPREAKDRAMVFFQNLGWSKEQAAGIVANLMAESKLNPTISGDSGRAYGIAQWHPDRQADFAKWSGKDIRQSSLEEQMAFVNYELTQGGVLEKRAGKILRMTQNAARAGEVMSRYYERPFAADAQAKARAESAVQISQTTNVTVNGASQPAETAQAVAGAQNDVNALIIRNLKSSVS